MKKRVLIYDASPSLGGAWSSLVAWNAALVAAGWQVHVVSVLNDPYLLSHGMPWTHMGGKVEFGKLRGLSFFAREATRAAALLPQLDRIRPQVVVMNNAPATNLAGHLAAMARGLPAVQYVRGAFHPGPLSAALFQKSRGILTVGEEVTRQVKALSPHLEPLHITEGLAPCQWPRPRKSGARRWMAASTSASWKGIPLLLEAYAQAARAIRLPELDLCLIPTPTSSPDGSGLPKNLPDGVTLHIGKTDLNPWREDASVFFHSSTRPEPFGRAILEAMAAGLCPVVPDQGGPRNLVRNQINALTYPMGDVDALGAVMEKLARHPMIHQPLGAAAALDALAFRAEVTMKNGVQLLGRVAETRVAAAGVPLESALQAAA
jgi:glycosyltransferase involved in cell wall biosynthesis